VFKSQWDSIQTFEEFRFQTELIEIGSVLRHDVAPARTPGAT
jgi:hypothetical protein